MVARMLGGLGRTLITAGTLILLFVAYQLWGTGLQERASQDKLERDFATELEQVQATSTTATTSTTTTAPVVPTTGTTTPGLSVAPRLPVELAPADLPLPKEGDPIATIEIPKIHIKRVVVEGAVIPQLKRGPAHYAQTPLPGQAGNAAIAGHRTTYGQPFHNVDKLEVGDIIKVETKQGRFEYQVDKKFVVQPEQSEVLLDTYDAEKVLENRITLTACEPKYSAAKRLIITGLLVGNPVPPIKGQPEARKKAGESQGDDGEGATISSIDGGLSGVKSSKTPAILWGLACAAVWLATWLVQVLLRRTIRARAEAQGEGEGGVRPSPSRGLRLLTWSPYLVGVPVFLVVLYVFFENFAVLLPGNY